MLAEDEYFGTPDMQTVTQNAAQLWEIVREDPRFHCHGRAVGVDWDDPGTDLSLHLSIARLQGAAACEPIPEEETQSHIRALEIQGMKTDRYEVWRTEPDALENARNILDTHSLKEDLSVGFVTPDTPKGDVRELAKLTESCGVVLPMGSFVRGVNRPSVYLYARDKDNRPVGHSSSTTAYHPDSQSSGDAHWGMLATHPDRRGEKIALILGAIAMVEMNQRHGFKSFMTGIRQGNHASENLCTKLRLSRTGQTAVLAIDPTKFSGAKLTK